MYSVKAICAVILALASAANCGNKIYMMKAQKMDQEASESGYVYTKDYEMPSPGHDEGPAVQLGLKKQEYKAPELPYPFYDGYKAPPPVQKVIYQPIVVTKYVPIKPIDVVGNIDEGNKKSSSSAGGGDYEESKFSKSGNDAEKSYKNVDSYEKGSKGAYDNQQQEGSNSEKGQLIKNSYDNAGNYADKYEKGSSYDGGSFGKLSYKKKGSETSGFHKVYHKDELKKKHTFYDESDHKGHFKKYDEGHKEHESEAGDFKKGGSSDNGYDEKNYGDKDSYDKGHYNVKDAKYNAGEGGEKYYENQASYAKNGGSDAWKAQQNIH